MPNVPAVTKLAAGGNTERKKAYFRRYNAERRRIAKALGICCHCNDEKARAGMATCRPCGFADALRHRKTA